MLAVCNVHQRVLLKTLHRNNYLSTCVAESGSGERDKYGEAGLPFEGVACHKEVDLRIRANMRTSQLFRVLSWSIRSSECQ